MYIYWLTLTSATEPGFIRQNVPEAPQRLSYMCQGLVTGI